MKTSNFKKITTGVLGVYLIIYALNQFFHFMPTSYGQMPKFTQDYLDAILPFLPALYIFEILVGIVLIMHKWVPFIALVLAPLSINFLIFNFANGGWNIISAAFVALMNLVMIYQYRDSYKPLFRS